MPYGGTSPAQDVKIEKCVADISGTNKRTGKPYTKSEKIAICKSQVMKNETNELILENVPLRFTAPILESVKLEEGKRKASGTLLVNTTSRNGVTYEIDEINSATYGGFPFREDIELTASLNHTEDVTDNVAVWKPIPKNGEIGYEATVFNTGKHPYVTDMMDKNLIKYVSVEAIAKTLTENSGKRIAKGLDIVGMGFVKTPGIKEVSLAIAEAFDEFNREKEIIPNEEIGDKMERVEEKKDPVLETLEKISEKLDKTKVLEDKLAELEKKMEEKKSKGIVTEQVERTKPRFNMVKVKNDKVPGTVNIYAEGINY